MHSMIHFQYESGENDGQIQEIKTIGRGYNKFSDLPFYSMVICISIHTICGRTCMKSCILFEKKIETVKLFKKFIVY